MALAHPITLDSLTKIRVIQRYRKAAFAFIKYGGHKNNVEYHKAFRAWDKIRRSE